ncbi:MAG TPA: ATP-binding protein [Nocardioidaceae bacterium]|nr:ATP-binding protein [Nocardioidaceae bacterium]
MHTKRRWGAMLVSPYKPGGTPRHLAGRERELQAIRDYLAPVIAYGEKADAQMVLHGPRGIGKTSVMAAAAEEARATGFLVAWTSCRRQEAFLADLAHSVERELRRAGVNLPAKRWKLTVDRVGMEVAVPALAKVSAEVKRGTQPTPPAGVVSAVEDLLHEAAAAAAGTAGSHGAGVGLLVAIDELHAGDPGELAVLLNASQNLNRERGQNPVALLGAGLPSTLGTLTSAATFGERSRWLGLPELRDEDLADAIIAPASELGVTWDPAAVQMALAASHHYPHFVQVMGNAVWLAARPEDGHTIGVEHARAGIRAGTAEVTDLHRARWGSLTAAEKRIAATIAGLGRDEVVSRSAIEAAVGGDISPFRARLLDKAVLEDVGRGRLRFTLPGFADFVLAETHLGTPDEPHELPTARPQLGRGPR